jgi:hypothetical protein
MEIRIVFCPLRVRILFRASQSGPRGSASSYAAGAGDNSGDLTFLNGFQRCAVPARCLHSLERPGQLAPCGRQRSPSVLPEWPLHCKVPYHPATPKKTRISEAKPWKRYPVQASPRNLKDNEDVNEVFLRHALRSLHSRYLCLQSRRQSQIALQLGTYYTVVCVSTVGDSEVGMIGC